MRSLRLLLATLAAVAAPSVSWGSALDHQAAALNLRGPLGPLAKSSIRAGYDRADRIVLKFEEGSRVRLRGSRLVSLDPSVDLTAIEAFFARHPGLSVSRRFARDEATLDRERTSGIAASAWQLADLNLYYEVHLANPSVAEGNQLLGELRSIEVVEQAFPDPVAQPAGAPASAGSAALVGPGLPTPDFTGMQGYLGASPNGINAQAVWGFPGGRGANVKLIDVEGAWNWTHEDLRAPFFQGGTQIADQGWRDHGTAVMGEMIGANNGFGVTGIASDMQVGCSSIGDQSVAAAINLASANLAVGDLFLIELHAPGPNANGSGQYGYVPMEWWSDNFDAIQTAVANGRICIEAGGNGEQNLDDPVYLHLFDRAVRNSGAILVGAGTPTGLTAEWFTNYGSRIDLNGWGSSVTTTGYGTLQGGAENQWYTSGFGGTSSASPIISGAVSVLQGLSKAQWGVTLDANVAVAILSSTGTPWNGNKRIGPRPNLVAARNLLLQGVGTISGTVRDAQSLVPLAGVRIALIESGAFTQTDAAGHYALPVLAGAFTLHASEFFHDEADVPVTVGAGQNVVQDVALNPKPTGSLTGVVRAQTSGTPLANAEVRFPNVPIAATHTNGSGQYSVSGIPAGIGYLVIYGGVPTKGGAYRQVDIIANNSTAVNVDLADAQTFEANSGSYTPQSPWAWGVPTGVGPSGAFSGSKLWATNLTGNYGDNQSAYLTTPVFNFAGAARLYLSFTHWYSLEAGFDGGNVQVKSGLSWVTVAPVGGYPEAYLDGLGGEGGFSGDTNGWRTEVIDLSAFASNQTQVRFHFGSDGGVNLPGWYLDDVAFDTGPNPSAVESIGKPLEFAIESIRPNPARGASVVSFTIPETGWVQARVVDASGRLVRALWSAPLRAGRQSLVWDGRNERGRAVGSGVFFLRIETETGLSKSARLLRVQ
ncbi:MAG: carboxypeptidase regulatory-like domain-containing protein [Candidatus Eisenbacteria bacterium]